MRNIFRNYSICLLLVVCILGAIPSYAASPYCRTICEQEKENSLSLCATQQGQGKGYQKCLDQAEKAYNQCIEKCDYPDPEWHLELRWFRVSNERKIAYQQVYSQARKIYDLASHKKPRVVVFDVDETVLDNSEYEDWLAQKHVNHSSALWKEWVDMEKAPAFKPAKDFIEHINSTNGRVILVTNRSESICQATKDNLAAQGIKYYKLMCAKEGEKDKQARFKQVMTDPETNNIVLFIGDSSEDFPDNLKISPQEIDSNKCLLLPNPMYGTWIGDSYQ